MRMPNAATQSVRPVSRLVISWILMIPLVYFASWGSFWFQAEANDNSLMQGNGSLVRTSATAGNAAVALIVFTIIAILVFPRALSVVEVGRKDKIFALLATLALLSCAWSQFPLRTIEYSLCLGGNTLFAFYLCRRFNSRQLLALSLMLGWCCLVVSIMLALFVPRYGLSHLDGTGSWRGIYPGKNVCSEMTVFLLTAAFFAPTTGLFSKLFRILYTVLSILLVLMTQSATGKILLVGLFAFLIVVIVLHRLNLRGKAVVLIVACAMAFSLVAVGFSYEGEISYLLGKDPTLSGRTQIWGAVMASATKRLILGYGYMAFFSGLNGENANASFSAGSIIGHAHNGLLEIWIELGLLGSALVVYCLVRTFKNSFVCLSAGKSSYLCWCACIAFMVAVYSIDETPLLCANNLAWILFIVASVGLSEGARNITAGPYHG